MILVGSEARAGPARRADCDQLVSIPMHTQLESLDSGAAAGIAPYAVAHGRE